MTRRGEDRYEEDMPADVAWVAEILDPVLHGALTVVPKNGRGPPKYIAFPFMIHRTCCGDVLVKTNMRSSESVMSDQDFQELTHKTRMPGGRRSGGMGRQLWISRISYLQVEHRPAKAVCYRLREDSVICRTYTRDAHAVYVIELWRGMR